MSIFETVMKRVDSWVNQITGVSATGGRNAFTFTGSGAIDDGTLTDLYEENPIIARIVDAVPDEGTRQGFSITGLDTAQSSLVNGLLDDLGLGAAVAEAWAWGRLYGGALIFVGADDGMPVDTPLDADRVRALRFLRVVEKQYAFPDRYVNDPTSATHGDVERWRFHDPETGRVSLVHRSRVIRFDGVRTSLRRRRRNNGWAHSEVRRVLTVLSQYEGGWASALTLLNDASQGVFSINDLFAMLASDKNDLLRKRLQFMDETRSVSRSIMLDANSEKYERVETGTLAGLPGVLDGLTLKLAQAARIPVTILMGQAPAGLNATGDSDIRWFYDRIRTEQINVLKPRLERIVRLAMRAQGVTEPESWGVNFASLYQLTDSEKTDMRSKQSAIDVAYINAQVLTPEEVRASRFRPEGYSTETSIDDDSTTGPDAGELGDVAAGVVPEDALAVVKSVAAREIPRDSGLQAILAAMPGLAIEQAERIMGEAGKTFFTTPDPLAQPELEQLRAENAALKRSVHGLKTWNSRIVQRARDGGLELGGLVDRPPTEVAEGDDLQEGDVVAVPAEPAPAPADAPSAPADAEKADGRADAHPSLVGAMRDAFAAELNGVLPRVLRNRAATDEPSSAVPARSVAVVLPLPANGCEALATVAQLPLDQLHVTLAYFEQLTDEQLAALRSVVAAWAKYTLPIFASLDGHGRFAGENGADPVYVAVDAPELSSARAWLLARLLDAGLMPSTKHPFVPHVTIAYVAPGVELEQVGEPTTVTFDGVAVWRGEERDEPIKLGTVTP